MTTYEADIMLQQKENGAFIVRKQPKKGNPEWSYIVSFKHKNRLRHTQIEDNGQEYSITDPEDENQQITAMSLRTLIVQLKVRGILQSPVTDTQIVKGSDSSVYPEFFQDLLTTLDHATKTSEGSTQAILCGDTFQATTMKEAFQTFTGIQKEVCLMILQQVFPSLADESDHQSDLQTATREFQASDPSRKLS